MTEVQKMFFEMYKMDWEFHFVDKNYMKGLVVDGSLSVNGYKQIVGEDYVAQQTSQPVQVQNA